MRKLIYITVIAILMACLAGCERTWIFNFSDEDIDEWGSEEISEIPGDGLKLLSPGSGLVLSNYTASTPMSFRGDLEVEVGFTLDVAEDSYAHFEIYIADGTTWRPENYIHSMFDTIGKAEMEYWQVSDFGSMGKGEGGSGFAIDDLNRQGPNVFKLIKMGDSYEIYMNSDLLAAFDSEYCRSDCYYLTLSANLEGGGSVIFNNVSVKYDGGTR